MKLWLRGGAVIVAAALSVATSPAPAWRVTDQAAFIVELSEGAPTVSFLVSASYDVPDDGTELVLVATARIERSIGEGETLSLFVDADDGMGGGASDSRELSRTLTVLVARASLDYCGRPCDRTFVVSLIWDGAPINDFTDVELELEAFATGGDSTEVPDGASVVVTAELLE